jgi:putative hydrolase of the HAD superfamily
VEDVEEFIEAYEEVNADLWSKYEAGQIEKAVLRVLRFRNTLVRFGVRNDRLTTTMGHEYLERCPRRTALAPGALGLLELARKDHRIHIITNGFEEVQHVKVTCSGLAPYIDVLLTSEQAGAGKPDPRIFHLAMRRAGAVVGESLMVGDSAGNDMAGARGVGMDHAHYTAEGAPDPLATMRFAHFDELRDLLT